jgi:hypothetical protein
MFKRYLQKCVEPILLAGARRLNSERREFAWCLELVGARYLLKLLTLWTLGSVCPFRVISMSGWYKSLTHFCFFVDGK